MAGVASRVRLVREPIELAALVSEIAAPGIGAIATFVGVVRAEANADGRALRALEYSAYEPMAIEEMARLHEAAAKQFEIHDAVLVHRLGELRIGEASVAVVVSAAHRAAALDACRELIERLKASVPIFKKELWQGGATSWVEPR